MMELMFGWVLNMSKNSLIGFWRGWRWPVRFPLLIELVSVMRYSRPLVPNAKVQPRDCGLRMIAKFFFLFFGCATVLQCYSYFLGLHIPNFNIYIYISIYIDI